jgi:acyl-CoA synthetase (AMP-forming)/AMP-acid ligase II
MQTHNNLVPSATLTKLKNTIWVLPYLAIMGMIWGYLAAAVSGVIIGLLVGAAASVIISKAGKL